MQTSTESVSLKSQLITDYAIVVDVMMMMWWWRCCVSLQWLLPW